MTDTTTNTRFLFKMTHPIMYATSLVVQAPDYSSALPYAQAHTVGTDWKISAVKNLDTGETVTNG